jgi:hypothetical protein
MAPRNSAKLDASVQARLPVAERRALDDWRRVQPELPTRPQAVREAIRRLVTQGAGAGSAEHAA